MDLGRPVSTLGGVHPLLQPGVNKFHVCLHFIYCGTHCSHHLSGLHHSESNSGGILRPTQSYLKQNFLHLTSGISPVSKERKVLANGRPK